MPASTFAGGGGRCLGAELKRHLRQPDFISQPWFIKPFFSVTLIDGCFSIDATTALPSRFALTRAAAEALAVRRVAAILFRVRHSGR